MVPEIWSETKFSAILGHFLPFNPPHKTENQTFQK